MPDQPAPGSTLGSYRLTEQVGQGGMGVVFRGEHVETGQVCALKVLSPSLATEEGFRARFERESSYAGSLDHPNVVSLYDAGEEDGVLYMAMQYVDGTDLKALLAAEGRLDPARSVDILAQVAAALDAAHATGLLHRDVKPGNIMLEPGAGPGGSDRCYLTDFGLSKNPSSDSFALTQQGSFVGTIDYTAPEQILAKPFDHRVDIYSLACVLYECLTGEVPFPKARDVEVLYGHIQDSPPRLTEKRPDVPAALDDVIATAMAKDPDDRHPSCTALIDAARAAAGVPEPAAAPPAGAPRGEPVLKVVEGRAAGTQIAVAGEFLIGRHAEGDGKLGRDPEISRRHAMVASADGDLTIEDLGSTNGTFVNGHRLEAPCRLSAGDRIEVGDTVLEVALAPSGRPAPGATMFAPIPSSTPPSHPAAEVSDPLPPVEEGEHPEGPDLDLPTTPLKAVDRKGPPEQPVPAAEDPVPVPPESAPALGDPDSVSPPPAPTPPPAAPAKEAEPRGRVVLRVEIDMDSGELSVGVEDGPGVRVVKHADGRWTVEPE
ncbi:MAG: protein kinase [Thermoleophilaceae bacterium]